MILIKIKFTCCFCTKNNAFKKIAASGFSPHLAAIFKIHVIILRFEQQVCDYASSVLAAASTTCPTSTEVVTLPTPPGTGVIASTIGSTAA